MWELRLDKVEDKGGFHPLIHATAKKVTERARRHGPEHAKATTSRPSSAASSRSTTPPGSDNWGFVPLTENEVRYYAEDLKPILDETWTWIAERDGEVLGAALTLPDVNQWPGAHERAPAAVRLGEVPLVQAQDRRLPGARPRRQARVPGPRDRRRLLHRASRPRGPERRIWWGEMGWILETNEAMNRAMEGMGGKIVKRYRIFEKELEAARESRAATRPRLGRRSRAWRSDDGDCRKPPPLPLDSASMSAASPNGELKHAPVPVARPVRRSSRAAGCCSRCRCPGGPVAVGGWRHGRRRGGCARCARSAATPTGAGRPHAAGESCAARSSERARSSSTCTCWAGSKSAAGTLGSRRTASCGLRTTALRPAAARW